MNRTLVFLAILATALASSSCGNAGAQTPTNSCAAESGEFTLTATGFASAPTGTALYKFYPCEKLAHIFLPGLGGASNDQTFTAGPLPAFLIPATIQTQEHALNGFDNGIESSPMSAEISAGSPTIQFLKNGRLAGWTPSGAKGVGLQVITVFLD